WIGTAHEGLNIFNYENDNFIRYYHDKNNPESISSNFIMEIFEDSKGNIWIGTIGGGLNKYDKVNDEFIHYKHNTNDPYSINNDSIYSIIEDRYKDIWIATDGLGINLYDEKNDRFIFYPIKNEIKNYTNLFLGKQIYEDREGNFWIGTEGNGLYFWNRIKNEFTHFQSKQGNKSINNDVISDFYEDDDYIWISTDGGGINLFNKETKLFSYCNYDFKQANGLSSHAILDMYKDNENNLWIGTYTEGVNIYNPIINQFNYYSEKNDKHGLSHKSVLSLCEDSYGNIWIGTDGGGINIFDPKSNTFKYLKNKDEINSVSGDAITAILEDRNKNMWIGTFKQGLNFYNRKTNQFTHFKHNQKDKNSISGNDIWDIIETKSGKIIIAILGAGIDIYDQETNTFKHYCPDPDNPNSLSNRSVINIYEDSKNNIWICSEEGKGLDVLNLNTDSFKLFIHDEKNSKSISSNDINSIIEDINGNLWIGSRWDGLNLFNRETEEFAHFTVKNGLPDNNIRGLAIDKQGFLWISTIKGISKFDYGNHKFINYTYGEGILNNEFYYNSALTTKNGKIFFGGNNGLISFDPKNMINKVNGPEVIINGITIFNQTGKRNYANSSIKQNIANKKEIKIKPKQNTFIIEFTAFDYLNPSEIKYAYRMDGYDPDELGWIYTDASQRFVTYTNLPGGEYIFKVKAANSDGIWNETGTNLKFIVIPPFIKTIYFYLILIMLFISTIYLFVRYRVNRLENITKTLEKKVKLRTAEIENQKSEIEAQKDEIELQKQALIVQKEKIEKQNILLQEQHEELEKLVQERTKDLEEAKNKAEESDKLKTAFLTNLSHEVRTPMNAIIGFSGLLSDPEITEEQRIEFINHITHNSLSLLHMIDDIIDVSKIDSKTIEISKNECSLNVILVDLFSTYINYKTEIGKNHIDLRLNNPLKNENIKPYTDAYRLRQIFSHLLNNAFKYTDEGYIEFGVKQDDNKLIFFVKDTGIGIPEDKKTLIFDRFTKFDEDTSRQFRGTGIGLTLSKKLSNLLGGDLWVETEQNVGSVFYFSLPYIPKKETKEIFSVDWSKKTILVAEDEQENFILLQNILNKTNANILLAKNGEEALQLVKDKKNIDIILMDLRMPVMDGIESAKEIKKINKNIPIIGITAYTYSIDKEKLLDSGFSEIVTKPLKSNQFISFLMNYLNDNEKSK
ncbi:MAG: response regulator, partial [Bacteroidales bacterium]|nr:response regulator [Bacteroidales bacterium]